ncbi:MAG: hypothetical protein AAFP84_18825 [Actinomycetota bacterium]
MHERRRGRRVTAAVVAIAMAVTMFGTRWPSVEASAAATISVDRTVTIDPFTMAVGHTHTQYSLEQSGDPDAIAAGRALLSASVDIQNQHIYGWGTRNPNPSPGIYDWTTLDRRVQLMRDTGATPVITLCCAPDWMTELASETSTYPNKPPTARHYPDFADLARQVALRYPDVRHYVIWNEMKGFWNPGSAQWDYVSYTQMYNAVYDALKAVDPTLQVGGPYLVIESTGSQVGGWSTEPPVTRRNQVLLEYWIRHGRGADFVAIDRKVKDYHDTRVYGPAETLALTANFDTVASQVHDITGLPVWFIEQHVVGQRGGPVHFQAAGIASMLYHQLNGGAVATVGWKPEQAFPGGLVQENLFTSTQVADGGRALPNHFVYRFFDESFPPGTTRHPVSSSDPLVLGLASPAATVLINQHPGPVDVELDGVSIVLGGYEVARFGLDGARAGTSFDGVDDAMATPPGAAATSATSATDRFDAAGQVVGSSVDEAGGEIDERRADTRPTVDGVDVAAVPASAAVAAAEAPASAGVGVLDGPSGPLDWVDQVGTPQSDRVTSVAPTGQAVFVGGTTWGELVPGRHRGLSDGFVRRYDPDGSVVWTSQFGSPTNQGVADVASDADRVYAVGTTDAAIAGQAHLGAFDAVVRAYDRNGRVRWTRQFGTDGDDHATEVVAHRGVVYVAATPTARSVGRPTPARRMRSSRRSTPTVSCCGLASTAPITPITSPTSSPTRSTSCSPASPPGRSPARPRSVTGTRSWLASH